MKHFELNINIWVTILGGRTNMVQLLVRDVGFSKKIIRFLDKREPWIQIWCTIVQQYIVIQIVQLYFIINDANGILHLSCTRISYNQKTMHNLQEGEHKNKGIQIILLSPTGTAIIILN